MKLPIIKAIIRLPETKRGKVYYILLEDFEFLGIRVPAGFASDGATIPRIFWSVLPPVHRYFPAALLHDYMLTVGTRAEADAQFKISLNALNISWFRRTVMYGAVRLYALAPGLFKKIL